jgi:hypothetical protein
VIPNADDGNGLNRVPDPVLQQFDRALTEVDQGGYQLW